jgi:hypothetical protein
MIILSKKKVKGKKRGPRKWKRLERSGGGGKIRRLQIICNNLGIYSNY